MTNLAEQINTNIIVNNTPVSNTTTTTNTSSSVTSNIVGVFIDKPIVQINQFVKRDKTENTTKTYINHYTDMFMFICHKQLNNLTWDDIKNISLSQAKEYRDFLIEQDFASSTINQRIFACKALWDDFFENEKVSKNVFDLKKLKQINNSYDSLTDKEIQLLFDFCLEEKQKPQTKKLYFEFLYTTALRKNIAQSITINDIKRKLDMKSQREFYVIDVVDKEHQREVSIVDEFYNRLINNPENHKYNNNDNNKNNKLFHLDNHTADKVLKNFCKKYGIERNIVQHSVKSSSGDLV
ncbi:MAG: hypothetical protein PHH93_09085, partial [Prolixibacteraceae bacterium]|nr:hypothetical protein [Prolixibacteraceae bacterium]